MGVQLVGCPSSGPLCGLRCALVSVGSGTPFALKDRRPLFDVTGSRGLTPNQAVETKGRRHHCDRPDVRVGGRALDATGSRDGPGATTVSPSGAGSQPPRAGSCWSWRAAQQLSHVRASRLPPQASGQVPAATLHLHVYDPSNPPCHLHRTIAVPTPALSFPPSIPRAYPHG